MTFETLFKDYLTDMQQIQHVDRAEAQIVTRFVTFINRAFDVEAREFIQEEMVRMVELQSTGRVDLLFGGLVLEFKKKLLRRSDARQLEDYLRGYAKEGKEYTGIFTDGLTFEIYALVDDSFEQVDTFNLMELTSETARIRLDAYFFSQQNMPPTAEDIVLRYGSGSPTFRRLSRELHQLLKQLKNTPRLRVWREQWERLLSRVYGSRVGDDDLFVRHTYLCQFARLLAYAAINKIPDRNVIDKIITGDAFRQNGVDNIGEADFFSWILLPEVKDDAIKLFDKLINTFAVYNLSQVNQDLLKQLYQNLVDAKNRHDLGEYYTPDWLAELTLREVDYSFGQNLYDPTCGSGSFLFSAIKHLEKQGKQGRELVDFTTGNIVGTDVHPLAVTIARVNYMLALSPHLRETGGAARTISVPVYMADAMLMPLENEEPRALEVPVGRNHSDEIFQIPYVSGEDAALFNDIIDFIEMLAKNLAEGQKPDRQRFQQRIRELHADAEQNITDMEVKYWIDNLHLLQNLIQTDRNSIWAYILKNVARPLTFANSKFDVVIGNPPWLAYRYIKNKNYQKDVKLLYHYYGLGSQVKLYTQMDMSTLFYALAHDRYMKPGGKLAFVMPRSVITAAKQHRLFQRKGITRGLDLWHVQPLFNVPSCVLIYEGEEAGQKLPLTVYEADLPAHELPLSVAEPLLSSRPSSITFVETGVRGPYYYDRFQQGATLTPRNFCFVKPQGTSGSPAVMTDPEADKYAKPPYKGEFLQGVVHDEYLYATVLSRFLLPFGVEQFLMVALPFTVTDDDTLQAVTDPADYLYTGHAESGKWFEKAAAKWDALKGDSDLSFMQQLDYRSKISIQKPLHPCKIIYNSNGSNISAAVIHADEFEQRVYGRNIKGFVAESTTYCYDVRSVDEAHYLCAVLNAPSVNQAIKDYQAYGSFGARHIHRTPFEACGIPAYDPADTAYHELATLSRTAHDTLRILLEEDNLSGRSAQKRAKARDITAESLTAIDKIVRRIVEM